MDLTNGSTFFVDNDGDGYGSSTVEASEQSSSMVLSTVTVMTLASSNPMATDIAGDGIDQNCDSVDGTDFDGDGYASTISGGEDCNDKSRSTQVHKKYVQVLTKTVMV